MTILSPAMILMGVILGLAYLFGNPTSKRVAQLRMELSADDVKTYHERYRSKANRADMPTNYTEYATATDRAARIYLTTIVAIVVALFAIIFLGPNLGLPLGDTP